MNNSIEHPASRETTSEKLNDTLEVSVAENVAEKRSRKDYSEWGFLQPNKEISVAESSELYVAHDLALRMPELIKEGHFRELVAALPHLDTEKIPEEEVARAKVVLGMLAQAFVWCNGEEDKAHYIPESLAVPLVTVSERLGEPPIFNYADYVLRNTQLVEPEVADMTAFRGIYTYTGMESEHGFIVSHVLYELKGQEAIEDGNLALAAVEKGDVEATKIQLEKLGAVLPELMEKFNTVYETTKETDFRECFRIFLKGWKNVIPDMEYRGVEVQAPELRGETGAQSSLLPFLDSVVGASKELMGYNPIYGAWRDYMPEEDREFLSETGLSGEKLRQFVAINPTLVEAYNKVLDGIVAFRRNHLVTITQYIEGKKDYTPGGVGTGGSYYSQYLGGLIDHLESLKF